MDVRSLPTVEGVNDWDPGVFLWDGTNVIGGFFLDDDFGTYGAMVSDTVSDGVTTGFVGTNQLAGGALPGLGNLETLGIDFSLDQGSGSFVQSGFGGSLAGGPFAFDRTQAISLLIGRLNINEQIEVHGITVETNQPGSSPTSVSEPGAVALMGAGLFGLGLAVRRPGRSPRFRRRSDG